MFFPQTDGSGLEQVLTITRERRTNKRESEQSVVKVSDSNVSSLIENHMVQ